MGSTLKGKNLLLWEQILFLIVLTPNETGGKNENDRVAPPKRVPIHLNSASVYLGPVVLSIVSLTSSVRGQLFKCFMAL